MNNFKVGDKVEVVDGGNFLAGDKGTVVKVEKYPVWIKVKIREEENWKLPENLKLISKGELMSKYQDLKQRIEAINQNTTVKEWDDLLMEIVNSFSISGIAGGKAISIDIVYFGDNRTKGDIRIQLGSSIENFQCISFTDQCSRGNAHKKAMLWLLDNSDIKKVDNSAEIGEIKKEMERLQTRVRELEIA